MSTQQLLSKHWIEQEFHYVKKIRPSTSYLTKLHVLTVDCLNSTFAEAFFRKWKKSWIVVCSGGPVRVFKNKNASRPQKSYDLKMDCIVIKTGRQVLNNENNVTILSNIKVTPLL